jgi:hypothetical protein
MYVANLGGASNQKNFRSSHSRGDTPLGAHDYTNVQFEYEDSRYGPLILTWDLRGKHNADFLKFDDSFRLFQLTPYGHPGSYPPTLAIQGIEGVQPEFRFPQPPANSSILSPAELARIRDAKQDRD